MKQQTLLLSFIFMTISAFCYGQNNEQFADSIRKAYHIPELNYAVLSSEKIIEMKALGSKKANTTLSAALTDRFRIGSNTKTITSYIATVLVKEGKIKWETPFFDLFPELKNTSNPGYYHLTLQDFLNFRANLIPWTYTNKKPTQKEIKGDETEQRYAFAKWILQQKPNKEKQTIYWSNPSYVLAGMMLEKATGKNYKTLVRELGEKLDIEFGFGQPNFEDINQTWGHNEMTEPEKPGENYKLNWLLSAGNVNVSLAGYSKFIQMQLQGLLGKSEILTADEFYYMHYGFSEFSFGWQSFVDENNKLKYSFHTGNPGTFLTKIYLCKDMDRAFIFFTNVQSEEAETGLKILFEKLNKEQITY